MGPTVPSSHVESQAKPLSLAFIVGLEKLVSSKKAVLRFAHVQRSKIIQVLDNAIFAQASLGKRCAHGRQRPFDWRAPRWGATGLDIGAAIHSFLRRAFKGKEQPGYFLPDLLPERCTLQSATGFASRPILLGRLGRLSQRLFQRAPFNLSSTEAADLTSYSARRVLPTLSELCRQDLREMLLVGDWKGTHGEAADLNMPLRYADQKLRASLCINTELVRVMRHVLNSDVQTSLGWDKLSEVFPSRRAAKQELLKMGPAATYLPETTSKGGCSSSCSSGSSCSSDSDGSGSPSKSAPEPDNGC